MGGSTPKRKIAVLLVSCGTCKGPIDRAGNERKRVGPGKKPASRPCRSRIGRGPRCRGYRIEKGDKEAMENDSTICL